jgi:hypothetical protein
MSQYNAITTKCCNLWCSQGLSMNVMTSILIIAVLLLEPITGFTVIQQQRQHQQYKYDNSAIKKVQQHRCILSGTCRVQRDWCAKFRKQSKLYLSSSSATTAISLTHNATTPPSNVNISNEKDIVDSTYGSSITSINISSSSPTKMTEESTTKVSIVANTGRRDAMSTIVSTKSASTTKKKKNLKMFPRYLEVECWKRQELRGLEPVLQAVAEACQQINRIVQRAQTDDLYGVAVSNNGNNENVDDPITNIQGETQQKLDVLCNTIMLRTFCGSSCDTIQLVASEEEDNPRCCSDVMVRVSIWKRLVRPLRPLQI